LAEERRFELSVPRAVKTPVGAHLPETLGCAQPPEGQGGGCRRYEFDCV
jgi:hypothetical protein